MSSISRPGGEKLRRHQEHTSTAITSVDKMGDISVQTSSWKLVEVGRVVLFSVGPFAGRLAAIVEIIDHKRVLVEGPSSKTETVVPRHSAQLTHVSLTPIVLKKIARAAGTAALKKQWEEQGIEKTWSESAFAQKREKLLRRRTLTDFERFKVLRLRKQARFEVRKAVAAAKVKA